MATIKPQTPIINWGHPLTRGLVYDIPFFEGGSTNSKEGITGASGTFVGSTKPTWSKDLSGSTVKFTGSGTGANAEAVDYGNPNVTKISTKISVAALVMLTAAPANNGKIFARIISANADPFFDWELAVTSGALPQFGISNGTSGTAAAISGATALTVGVWYSIVGTYDAANMRLYVNTVPATPVAKTGAIGTTAIKLYAGGNPQNSGADGFLGKIAYARIWNRVLTPQETINLYTNPWQIYQSPRLTTGGVAAAVVAATVRLRSLLGVGL